MYCPDVAVSLDQVNSKTSTYEQVVDFHASNGTNMPLNINGKPFIRKLTDLAGDLQPLLDIKSVQKRFTVDF